MTTLTRSETKEEDCWNVKNLYPSLTDWEKDFKQATSSEAAPHWPELSSYRGRLGSSAAVLKEGLEKYFAIGRKLDKIYTYTHLRHDEEITEENHKKAYEKALGLYHEFKEESAWLEPEILALPKETLDSYLKDPILATYKVYLDKLIHLREHTLSTEQEELLALAGKALETPYKVFSSLNNADFKFPPAIDQQGQSRELTHGLYQLYLRDRDRVLRENAFKTLHRHYEGFENSLCELIQGQLQTHRFNAKARHYDSCLEAALKPKDIDTSVYKSLIEAVRSEISALHEYVDLRKKVLKLDELHLYDLYVPLTSHFDMRLTYPEAEKITIESVAPLGSDYQNALRDGLEKKRWVDRYENKNKRSGAYSSGCYDSFPYILLNFKGILNDLFTLAHEAGHSMHSLLSKQSQPYHYSRYPIFVAEVASTFNEELLVHYLLKNAKSKDEKIFLINQKIEDIRATLFRQTLFAEFELLIHEKVERKEPLTPALLKEEYRKLNAFYYGPNIVIDKEIDIEWARIPHFYYDFYVYQYATGISAALSLASRVLQGGEAEREQYLTFLKSGSSQYPLDLLKTAGIDMRSPAPIKTAIGKFRALVHELDQLLS